MDWIPLAATLAYVAIAVSISKINIIQVVETIGGHIIFTVPYPAERSNIRAAQVQS